MLTESEDESQKLTYIFTIENLEHFKLLMISRSWAKICDAGRSIRRSKFIEKINDIYTMVTYATTSIRRRITPTRRKTDTSVLRLIWIYQKRAAMTSWWDRRVWVVQCASLIYNFIDHFIVNRKVLVVEL